MDNFVRRNINRKQEPLPVDEWLKTEGYFRKAAPKDPGSLFRAVSEQIYNAQFYHNKVRKECIEFMKKQRHLFEKKNVGSFDNYLEHLSNVNECGGMMEIEAMSLLYKRDFVIFYGGQCTALKKKIVTNNGFNKFIYLCHTPPRHYETVYKNQIMATAAFCQSLVYKILYKNVFKMPDVDTAVEKMLHDDGPYQDKNSRNELSVLPFPYRVAKALDPNIYRNTDFDIWFELRRQVRTAGLLRWNNYRLQVGGKCYVKITTDDINHGQAYINHQSDRYSNNNNNNNNNNLRITNRGDPMMLGHIQEMAPNEGPVVVYIQDLGEKRTVPFRALVPLQQRSTNSPAITSSVSAKNKHDDVTNKYKKQPFNGHRKTKDSKSPVTSPRFNVNDDENNNRNNNYKTSPNKINYSNNYGHKTAKNDLSNKNHAIDSHKKNVPSKVPTESPKQNVNFGSDVRDCEKRNGFTEDSKINIADNKNINNCEAENKKGLQSEQAFPSPNVSGEFNPCSDMNIVCVQPTNEMYTNLQNPYYENENFGESQDFAPTGFINYSNQIINFRVPPSLDINGNDLPYSDISTLRYFFNLGLEYFNINQMWWPQNEIPYPAAPPNTPLSPPPSPPRSLNFIPPENPPVPVVDQCYTPVPVDGNITQHYDNSEYHRNYSPTNHPKYQQRYITSGSNDNQNENFSFKNPSKKKSPSSNNKFSMKSKNEQDITYNSGTFKYIQGHNENGKEFNISGDSPRKNQPGRFKKNNQGYQNRTGGKLVFQHDQQKLYNTSEEENYPKKFDKKNIHDCHQQKNRSPVSEMQNQFPRSPPNNCTISHQINFANSPYYPNEADNNNNNNNNNNVYGSPQGNIYPISYVPHTADVPTEVKNFPAPVMYTNPGNYPQHMPPIYSPLMYSPPPPLLPHMTSIFTGLPGQNSPTDWCVSANGQPNCIPYAPYPAPQPNELPQIKK